MTPLLITANILGYIGLFMLYFQIVFGSRHVFKYFTKDTVKINKLHSTLGKYAIFAVLLHPILSMANRLEDLLWIVTPSFVVETEKHITFGRFALVLFLVVWVTSALVRGKIKWRPWKWVHLLAYPIVFLTLIHLKDIGTFYEEYAVFKFVYAFIFITFAAAVLARLLIWGGLTKQKYTLVEKTLVGTDIVIVKLAPQGNKVTSRIGQHFFLQSKRFGSEHPFSIIRNEDGALTFGIRKVAGFWNEITDKEIGGTLYVDGPYGVFTREAQNTNPKVIISAGIGVTPFIDLAERFGSGTTYINCNRRIEEAVDTDRIKNNVDRYIDIVDAYEGTPDQNVRVGRISVDIIQEVVGQDLVTKPFFVCGSPVFIRAIKTMLHDAGVPNSNIYFEELGF